MTWAEFKRRVEAAGVTDADNICYIDLTLYDDDRDKVGAYRTPYSTVPGQPLGVAIDNSDDTLHDGPIAPIGRAPLS